MIELAQQFPLDLFWDWLIGDFPSWAAAVMALGFLLIRNPTTRVYPLQDTWTAQRKDGQVTITGRVFFQPMAQGFTVTGATAKTSWWPETCDLACEQFNKPFQGVGSQSFTLNVRDAQRDTIKLKVRIALADKSRGNFTLKLPVTEEGRRR